MSGFVDVSDRACVLFDFDGTLADTKQAICSCARAALTELGMEEAEMGDLCRLIGPPFPQAYQEVYGFSEVDAAWVTERYRVIWDGLGSEAIPLFEGVREMLAALRAQGKTLVVATSKAQKVIEDALLALSVEDAFDLVVGKPHEREFTKAETIMLALDTLGLDRSSAVMVGDRHYDIEGAREVGIPSIGVTWGGVSTLEELKDAGADLIVDTLDELMQKLSGGVVLEP